MNAIDTNVLVPARVPRAACCPWHPRKRARRNHSFPCRPHWTSSRRNASVSSEGCDSSSAARLPPIAHPSRPPSLHPRKPAPVRSVPTAVRLESWLGSGDCKRATEYTEITEKTCEQIPLGDLCGLCGCHELRWRAGAMGRLLPVRGGVIFRGSLRVMGRRTLSIRSISADRRSHSKGWRVAASFPMSLATSSAHQIKSRGEA